MNLNLQSLKKHLLWSNYCLPHYDIEAMRAATARRPTWLHIGAGNLCRAFPAVLCQRLLTAGLMDTGLIVCEAYDEELIERVYRAHDNLTVCVTMHVDGTMHREIVGSIAESLTFSHDADRIRTIVRAPSLQMITLTITQKAYHLRDLDHNYLPEVHADMQQGPAHAATLLGRLAAMCIDRYRNCGVPLAFVSLDNYDRNGEKLQNAIMTFISTWHARRLITDEELAFVRESITFPLTMADKATPGPSETIAHLLRRDDLYDPTPFVTAKGTRAAAFVNTEPPQYLLIEDSFGNGHPPLEQIGVIFTNRDLVSKAAHMKACTCLNPLDTALGVFGSLLGYDRIYEAMGDPVFPPLLEGLYQETRAVCDDPGILAPDLFMREALTVRYPNPFMPDSPQRMMNDTSQKLPIRFGVTLRQYYDSPNPSHSIGNLHFIPLVLAGWIRYLLGVDDNGNQMKLSPDPMLDTLHHYLRGITFHCRKLDEDLFYPLLSNAALFGCNLYEIGLAPAVISIFRALNDGAGAVRGALERYVTHDFQTVR